MSDSFFVLNDVLQCGVPLHCFDNLIGSKIGLFIILRSQQVFSTSATSTANLEISSTTPD